MVSIVVQVIRKMAILRVVGVFLLLPRFSKLLCKTCKIIKHYNYLRK